MKEQHCPSCRDYGTGAQYSSFGERAYFRQCRDDMICHQRRAAQAVMEFNVRAIG